MAFTKPLSGRPQAAALKGELGSWIRDLREARGMTQAQLSVAVGHEYYTSISAVETGRNTPPPERLLDYAEALGVTPTEFGKRVLELTNPWLYAMLFSKTPRETFATLNGDIETRAGRNPSKRRPPTRTTKA